MRNTIIKNRLKWYVPFFTALTLLTLLFGIFGGFNYPRYWAKPVPLSNAPLKPGTYVRLAAGEIISTFALYGYEPENTDVDAEGDYLYRYVVAPVGADLVGIRLTKSQMSLPEGPDTVLVGTLREAPRDILLMLRQWAVEGYWMDWDGLQIARHTPNVMLYVDYMGDYPAVVSFILFALTAVCGLAALAFAVRFVMLMRRKYEGYGDAKVFGKTLIAAPEKVLLLKRFTEIELQRKQITRIFPRNKRLEGGKLRWVLVFMSGGREYTAKLVTEERVQEALAYVQEAQS